MRNQKGFTVVEVIIVVFVLFLTLGIGLFAFGRISASGKADTDAKVAESLEKARKQLATAVTESKTIPDSVTTVEGVSYSRKDNQTAELCASFAVPRSGKYDNFVSPVDSFKMLFSAKKTTIKAYRDDVDFAKHSKGRNCFEVSYAPINDAYQEQYRNTKKSWTVCDSLRQYTARFTGQTIKGFTIGGPITTNPGMGGGNGILGQDVDAYDTTCKKIPVSALKVGDRVEIYFEDGPKNGGNQVYFVKALKKEY